MPDASKSCAACCGLYNVTDGRRDTLTARLARRTNLFAGAPRSLQGILQYEAAIGAEEGGAAVDQDIHVCVFAGFTDTARCAPGCMLHPSLPANDGMDYRGLCHYGSLACRTFYCPSWEAGNSDEMRLLIPLPDDWHLYGLVMPDLPFVQSIFALLDLATVAPLEHERLLESPAAAIVREMVSWKDQWPLNQSSTMRRSRYYLKDEYDAVHQEEPFHISRILDALDFTFGIKGPRDEGTRVIREATQRFQEAYGRR